MSFGCAVSSLERPVTLRTDFTTPSLPRKRTSPLHQPSLPGEQTSLCCHCLNENGKSTSKVKHFFKFLFYFLTLQYCIGFAIYRNESATGIHVSPSWTLLLLPPHTIPLGRPSAPSPSIQYRASNLDWWLISYMILYMLQCHSPKSSHPLPLPQSPQDCPIHQCLFCCLM